MMCSKMIGKIQISGNMCLLSKPRTSLRMEEMFFTVNFYWFLKALGVVILILVNIE